MKEILVKERIDGRFEKRGWGTYLGKEASNGLGWPYEAEWWVRLAK